MNTLNALGAKQGKAQKSTPRFSPVLECSFSPSSMTYIIQFQLYLWICIILRMPMLFTALPLSKGWSGRAAPVARLARSARARARARAKLKCCDKSCMSDLCSRRPCFFVPHP